MHPSDRRANTTTSADRPDRLPVMLTLGAIVVAILLLTLFVDLLHNAVARGQRLHAEQHAAAAGAGPAAAVDLLDGRRRYASK
jgi:hypothetical protein